MFDPLYLGDPRGGILGGGFEVRVCSLCLRFFAEGLGGFSGDGAVVGAGPGGGVVEGCGGGPVAGDEED
jgi:hypothetical protein